MITVINILSVCEHIFTLCDGDCCRAAIKAPMIAVIKINNLIIRESVFQRFETVSSASSSPLKSADDARGIRMKDNRPATIIIGKSFLDIADPFVLHQPAHIGY